MAGILGQRKRVAGGAGAATRSHPGVQRGRAARGPALSERTPEPMSVMCQCWASLDPRCGKHQLAGERQASPGTGQQMRTSVIGRLMCGSGAYHQSAVRPDSADTRPTGAAMSGLSKRNKGGLWLAAALVGTAMTLTVVTPAAAAARAPAVSVSGWAQFQGGAAHTGAEPGENSITAANVSQLSVAWTAPIPAAQTIDTSEVLVIGGSAYVSSVNEVIALDAATGATLWQATLPGAAVGTPAVQGGMVLTRYSRIVRRVAKNYVVALDSTTGATVWTRQVSGGGDSLTTTARRVYVTVGTQVEALGLAHGGKL